MGYGGPIKIQIYCFYLLPRYIRTKIDAQVALCVYDITAKDSFRVLKGWVEELKSKGPSNIILAVVGNKIDKADDEQVSYE